MFYEIPPATLCDICEGEDCNNACNVRAEKYQSLDEAVEATISKAQIAKHSEIIFLATIFTVLYFSF